MQFDESQIYCEPWVRANQSDVEIQKKQEYLHYAVGRTLKNIGGFVLLCAFLPRFEVKGFLSFESTSLSISFCLTFNFQTFELKINKAKRQRNKSQGYMYGK